MGDDPGEVFGDDAHACICSNSEPGIGSGKGNLVLVAGASDRQQRPRAGRQPSWLSTIMKRFGSRGVQKVPAQPDIANESGRTKSASLSSSHTEESSTINNRNTSTGEPVPLFGLNPLYAPSSRQDGDGEQSESRGDSGVNRTSEEDLSAVES